jgi:hypothetical protein
MDNDHEKLLAVAKEETEEEKIDIETIPYIFLLHTAVMSTSSQGKLF